MRIDNEFTVNAPLDQAWAVLTDLEGIAPCMPGAMLTGRDGDSYQGKVKIKVGPITSEYAGAASFVTKDESTHHAVIDAKGRDSRGAGNASATITADLTPDGAGTRVTVSTDLKLTGRIAQFGSGMIQEVSRKLLGQFVACLETKLAAPQESAAAEALADAAEPVAAPPATASAPPATASAPPATASAPPATASAPPSTTSAAAAAALPEPVELDLLALSRGALVKRLVPLLVGVVVVAIVVYLLVR